MKKNNIIRIIFLLAVYLVILFVFKNNIFHYRFDKNLINRYFLSQDITHEVPGKRLFLSDGDIYLSTGYLYIKGSDPSQNNFEHPPLIKYLFGLSILLFNNPFVMQVFLGLCLLIIYYFLSLKISKKPIVAFLSTFLLLIDPLFIELSTQPLLDLGQTVFMLLYFISIFFIKDKWWLQGLFLALFAGCKFWVTPLFFVTVFYGYKIYKKEFNFKKFFLQILSAFIFYSLLYTRSFILTNGHFNIIWHVLKTFKYRFAHNTSSFFGASIILFMTGYLKSWWGNNETIRIGVWSLMWPVTLIASVFYAVKIWIRKKVNIQLLMSIIPLVYLLYLGVQAPFPRYFIIFLPFLYLTLSQLIYKLLKKI